MKPTTTTHADALRQARAALELPETVVSLINGERTPPEAAAERLPIVDPATELTISMLVEDSPSEVDRAVAAARTALDSGPWGTMDLPARVNVLRQIQSTIERNAAELAYLDTLDTGVCFNEARLRKIPRIVENFEFAASLASMAAGETFQQNPRYLTYVTQHPVGVCAIIAPWNSPMGLATMQAAPCIAFGNTCVLKPSEHAPLSLYRLVELMHEAGLPPGVINLVNGRGAITGEALVRHPEVNAVKFIGGTETGKRIMASAAGTLKRVGLELGGKSANVIFDDADFEAALDGALLSIYSNNGQQCLAGSRILVQRAIANRFIEAFVARAERIRVGDPFAQDTELGPLAFEAHYRRVLGYAEIARAEGATVLTGGRRPESLDRGYFIAPTAVRVNDQNTRVCQEEIFGPFATFVVFDNVADAISLANESRFGLVAYVWSQDVDRIMRVSQAVRAGTVLANTPMVRELRAPFGGFKESGVGRDGARHTTEFYTEAKTTSVPIAKLQLRRLGAS
jgi:5-carboxymethyl-2-hydroxymuconic-semialdehyde dehydrogenase